MPAEWTVARLTQKHPSEPFNPDVANAFFRAGMVESWGRGIERMVRACQTAGVAAPELTVEPTGMWLAFHFERAVEPAETASASAEMAAETALVTVESAAVTVEAKAMTVETPVVRVETPVVTGGPVQAFPTVRARKGPSQTTVRAHILALLGARPTMSLKDVASEIGSSNSTVERAVAALTQQGRLEFVGPRKRGQWHVLAAKNP